MEIAPKPEPTKKQKFKKWCTDNKESLLVVSGTTTFVGAYIWFANSVFKEQQKAIEEYNQWAEEISDWTTEQHNSGNDVYRLEDGRWLVIPAKDNPAQLYRK